MIIGHGLTSCLNGKRCKKCDFNLDHSKWNNVRVVYSINTSKINGFLCIKCALNKSKHQDKPKVTIEQVEAYLNSKNLPLVIC